MIIYGTHGNARPIGAVLATHTEGIEKQKQIDAINGQIDALRKEQQEAIAEQNYEKAAELRDKIKALSEEGGLQ
jgi:protein-arginine kinase activator protein McsA